MSHEHAWPQWMRKHTGHLQPTRSSRTLGFGRVAEDALAEHETVITTKPGSVLNNRTREVCETCNNGWMSAMETRAEPLVMRLWAPMPTFGRTAIGLDDVAFLATWATKTAWMHERVGGSKRTATADMRAYLMDKQLPPELTSVWIGQHVGQLDFAHYMANFDVSHEEQPWDGAERRAFSSSPWPSMAWRSRCVRTMAGRFRRCSSTLSGGSDCGQ
jgi:hypothetical protein